jgi:apolipoprotein D and lipocalin family protein
MNLVSMLLIILFTAFSILSAPYHADAPAARTEALAPVSNVDLVRYVGKWYEIAKYPNRFQKKCVGNTTATYALKQNGRIEVVNRCTKADGKMLRAVGEAKVVDKKSNAKLKVRFAPSLLSFLPLVWGDYWVIDLADDYSYAVIGEPGRDYFWILSRTPTMGDPTYQEILSRAKSKGFDPNRVERSRQDPLDRDPMTGQ